MEKHEDADAPEERKNAMWLLYFFLQSVVLGALLAILLGRSGGGNTLTAVWRLSLLLCAFFYSAVCVLFTPTRKARLFFHLTYPILFAFVVDAVLSHAAGAVIVYLASVWMASIFGKILAEHSPSGKSASAAAAAENPASAQLAEEKLASELGLTTFVVVAFSPGVIVPMCITDLDWTLVFVVVMSMMLCLSLPVAIICAQKPLRRGGGGTVVVLGEECGTGKVLACWYISSFMLLTLSFVFMSELAAVVALWSCVLGLAVYLGYCLRLHTYYVHNMRSKPEMVARPDDEVKKKQPLVFYYFRRAEYTWMVSPKVPTKTNARFLYMQSCLAPNFCHVFN